MSRAGLFMSVLVSLLLASCESTHPETNVAWAVNIGGPGYSSVDGTRYAAEQSTSGGTIGEIGAVQGSQDPVLYQSYREGDVEIAHAIANGIFDITFHFAEPAAIPRDERIFDVFAEGEKVIGDIDVMSWRDGKVRSALTVTVPNVVVSDGELNTRFDASGREPILSALVVRSKSETQADWELAWSDEFEVDGAPDPAKWNVEEWAAGVVNNEDQAYTARPRNLRVEDGVLTIEAHKENYQGAKYTSGRIQSSGKGDFLYGRIEVKAKLPEGQGTWPAIWMLASDPFYYATTCKDEKDWQGNDDCDAWPNSGEIDIMEHVGYQMNHVHGTVHGKSYNWAMWEQRKGRIILDDVVDTFHVYALEWSPESIDIFVDDSPYLTYINENNGWEEWPFDRPFHLILNFAIGGGWGRAGGPIDDSVFPQRMVVDYARVYKSKAGKLP